MNDCICIGFNFRFQPVKGVTPPLYQHFFFFFLSKGSPSLNPLAAREQQDPTKFDTLDTHTFCSLLYRAFPNVFPNKRTSEQLVPLLILPRTPFGMVVWGYRLDQSLWNKGKGVRRGGRGSERGRECIVLL